MRAQIFRTNLAVQTTVHSSPPDVLSSSRVLRSDGTDETFLPEGSKICSGCFSSQRASSLVPKESQDRKKPTMSGKRRSGEDSKTIRLLDGREDQYPPIPYSESYIRTHFHRQ
ncbi:uncharacterized protein [Mycetomoellerius zeteki]|uniref:uncharacterized protein n=1 Tax=Mycetomoellerius zeteki TaxID=64791 RepID=UPI00084E8AC1|nr:PREDICTED: uncharacterized protein LOC108731783 [Trachymyrmex zeteki]